MGNFKYVLLTKKDVSSLIPCVVKTFLYDEPMTKNLGITEKEFRFFAKIVCEQCAKEKLSFVCKNKKSKVVGFSLNEDLIDNGGFPFEKMTEKMRPIFSILGKLDESYLKGKMKRKNFYFHLFMGGTFREYRNKGIVKNLIRKSLVLAKKKGYQIVIGEATNLKSQNLVGTFGFKEKYKIKYSEFKFEDKFVFKDIGEKYCKLMELKIT